MRILQEALTFDDVLLVPAHSSVLPRDVSLKTRVTRNLALNIPLLSAAMDTVTESRAAICIAQEGGLGIVHKNLSPDRQAEEVRRVKKFEAGVIAEPFTVSPETTVREVLKLTREKRISGVPVTKNGELVGIVTGRDMRFETRYDERVSRIMTPKERLVTVKEGATRDEILKLLHQHRIEKLLVIDEKFGLKGLVTVKDIQKSSEYPYSAKDSSGRLLVGAAVGVGKGTEERVEKLVAAGVDVVVVEKPTPNPEAKPGDEFPVGDLSADKTRYVAVNNYPANTDVTVEYVYENPAPFRNQDDSFSAAEFAINDDRNISVTARHSFIAVPENEFQPRRDDARIGYFTQVVQDMTSDDAVTPWRDIINRWHLRKNNPGAAVSEPVEPIVWWIENTTPLEHREAIREATLSGNAAFEIAGFRNAVEVKIQPDDADWDAGDIRYNVLRWTSWNGFGFGRTKVQQGYRVCRPDELGPIDSWRYRGVLHARLPHSQKRF